MVNTQIHECILSREILQYTYNRNRYHHTRTSKQLRDVSSYSQTDGYNRGEIFFSNRDGYILLLNTNARALSLFRFSPRRRTSRIPLNTGLYHPRPHPPIFLRAPSSKLMEFINSARLESATSLFLFKDGLLECPPMLHRPLTDERKLRAFLFFNFTLRREREREKNVPRSG